MAKTNVVLNDDSEKSITRMAYLAKNSKSKKNTPLKDEIIDTLISIARSAYDKLDEESFYNVTGLEK